jgi:hypothetical protein
MEEPGRSHPWGGWEPVYQEEDSSTNRGTSHEMQEEESLTGPAGREPVTMLDATCHSEENHFVLNDTIVTIGKNVDRI